MTSLKLLRALVVTCFLAFTPATLVAAEPPPEFDIRSGDGKVVIAADQIRFWPAELSAGGARRRDTLPTAPTPRLVPGEGEQRVRGRTLTVVLAAGTRYLGHCEPMR